MLKEILAKHVGYVIAINAIAPEKLESCGLNSVGEDCFSVVTQKGLLLHIPYIRIIKIIENNEDGPVKVRAGVMSSASARAVVHVEHMIIYQGVVASEFSF